MNRHVQFPLILDLAPYCAAKCKVSAGNISLRFENKQFCNYWQILCSSQNIYEGDTQILYSLYGVVEHSGTMRSGHYTAYVKARPDSLKSSSNGKQGRCSWVCQWVEQIISENSISALKILPHLNHSLPCIFMGFYVICFLYLNEILKHKANEKHTQRLAAKHDSTK